MRNRADFRIYIIIILGIILSVMIYFYFKDENVDIRNMQEIIGANINSEEEKNNESTQTLVSTTTQISSALTENVELHATYYLEECYVEADTQISSGDNILKYTNGKYLTAPYDCVITKLDIPDEEEKCTQNHYITVSATNLLQVTLNVDESIINEFYLGQEAKISVSALDNTEYTGYITDISNTASNGKFTITCEFENDKNIKIGMTANVVIEG